MSGQLQMEPFVWCVGSTEADVTAWTHWAGWPHYQPNVQLQRRPERISSQKWLL